MKSLLVITGVIEGFTGMALAIVPSLVINLLLGTPLTEPGAIVVGRLAGAALLTISIACWFSRNDTQSQVMVKAMLGYNIFSITVLVYAVLIERISGPGLWPAVILHLVLLVWCVSLLWKQHQISLQ